MGFLFFYLLLSVRCIVIVLYTFSVYKRLLVSALAIQVAGTAQQIMTPFPEDPWDPRDSQENANMVESIFAKLRAGKLNYIFLPRVPKPYYEPRGPSKQVGDVFK